MHCSLYSWWQRTAHDLLESSRRCRSRLGWTLLGSSLLGGCKDLSRFDTAPGEAYCGSIVASDFVRHGFDRNLSGSIHIDTSRLNSEPGRFTSNDSETGPCSPQPLFDNAPLLATPVMDADALSTLSFGREREHNFLSWVDSTCQGSMLAVVSLMHDETVELRLLRRASAAAGVARPDPGTADAGAPSDLPSGGDFALLQLSRQDCP